MLEHLRLGSLAAAVGLVLWLLAPPAFAQSCPGSAPLPCGNGCCPYGDGGRTDVCCPGNLCTRNGICSSSGGSSSGGGVCPSSAPLPCGNGCCPYGNGGRTDVCCPGNLCTSNGSCGNSGGGNNNSGGGDVCPSSAPLPCGNGCCPRGDGGRTDVCCAGTSCTRNGICGNSGGQVTSTITQAGDLVCVNGGNAACATNTCSDGTTCSYELNGVRICSGSCGAIDACVQQAGMALEQCARGNAPSTTTTTTTNTPGGGSTTTSPGGGSTTSRPGGSTTTSCSKPCKNLCCGVGTQCMYSVEGEPICLAPRSSSSDSDDEDDAASCALDGNGPVSNGEALPTFALVLGAVSLVGAARVRRRSVQTWRR